MKYNFDKMERVLNTLQEQSLTLMFSDKPDQAEDIETAIKHVRYGMALANKDKLLGHFTVFDTRNWMTLEDFLNNHTYIWHSAGIAVRKFNGQYYAVKITNPDSCFSGILQTDCPDNYPMHSFPDHIIHSEYPEIVMLKVIEAEEKKEEAEG